MPLLTDFIPQATIIPLNGNLGIGVSVPNERLTVLGNISASSSIFTGSNITANGNLRATQIGIGIAPSQALTVLGSISASGSTNTSSLLLGSQNKVTLNYTSNNARTYTITDVGTNADFVMTQGAQSIAGVKTFNETIAGSINGNAGTATSVVGGGAGQVLYNTSAGNTSFVAAGTTGQLLQSNGTSAPSWLSQSSLSAGNAALAACFVGNSTGQLLYQSANNVTTLLSYGTANQVLRSQGTGAVPLWTNQSALTAGFATNLNGGGPGGNIVFQSASGTTGYTGTGSFGQVLVSRGVESPVWASQSELLTIGQASLATNIVGGGAGQVPYQTAANTTAFAAAGTASHLLQSGGAGAPSWINPSSLTVGTASNLAGGSAGAMPYQSGTGATVQLAAGTAGQILRSGGAAAPSWINQSSIAAGTATSIANGAQYNLLVQTGASTTGFVTNGSTNQVLTYTASGPAWQNATTPIGSTTNLQINSLGVGIAATNTAGEIRATGNITAYATSDIRLKENIKPISDALIKVNSIAGVEYDWTKEYIDTHGGEDDYFLRKHDIGVIAQDVQKVLPEVVAQRQDGYLAVKYEKVVPLLIEAIKQLTNKVNSLEEEVKSLKA